MRILEAKDGSKNFIWDRGEGQALEARYVVRDKGELICYLSSQTACMRACRMCHLTRTGQVNPANASLDDFILQADRVLWESRRTYQDVSFWTVSYNFMARGEPLDNPLVDGALLSDLHNLAWDRCRLIPRFKISTIMPEDINLSMRFKAFHPDIYYSLYSVNPDFRKRWFPKAIDHTAALARLKEWQDFSHKIPKIHLALIKGENDDVVDLTRLCQTIQRSGIRVDFNIVRYNPYDGLSQEGDWELAAGMFRDAFPQSDIQTVQRVGYEAKASCGMFVS